MKRSSRSTYCTLPCHIGVRQEGSRGATANRDEEEPLSRMRLSKRFDRHGSDAVATAARCSAAMSQRAYFCRMRRGFLGRLPSNRSMRIFLPRPSREAVGRNAGSFVEIMVGARGASQSSQSGGFACVRDAPSVRAQGQRSPLGAAAKALRRGPLFYSECSTPCHCR
jgi:hypothetical protein